MKAQCFRAIGGRGDSAEAGGTPRPRGYASYRHWLLGKICLLQRDELSCRPPVVWLIRGSQIVGLVLGD